MMAQQIGGEDDDLSAEGVRETFKNKSWLELGEEAKSPAAAEWPASMACASGGRSLEAELAWAGPRLGGRIQVYMTEELECGLPGVVLGLLKAVVGSVGLVAMVAGPLWAVCEAELIRVTL